LPVLNGQRVYVETYGCQMNVVDSARMVEVLRPLGYEAARSPDEADLLLVNTCSVREKPVQKVISELGHYRALKQRRPDLVIGVGGCVATQEKGKLLEKVPHLDLVFGPDQIRELPALVARVRQGRQRIAETLFTDPEAYTFLDADPATPTTHSRATGLVTVMKGCDNVCSFCVVPYVRGREVSRPVAEVVAEVARLVEHGVREVTLLGQNVNSYGRGLPGEPSFVDLLEAVDAIPGLWRLRYTTSHPKDFDEPLARAHGRLRTLCEHIHLPVQSGSDRILARMRRRYNRAEYLEKVAMARQYQPRAIFTTDIIAGFPGETAEEFEETLTLVREVDYTALFSFIFSPRPHTAALRYPDDVPHTEKVRRLQAVQALQRELQERRLASLVGEHVEVLVEGPSKTEPGRLTGRTRQNHIVNFHLENEIGAGPVPAPDAIVTPGDSPSLVGTLLEVRIDHAASHWLGGVAQRTATTPCVPARGRAGLGQGEG
jgi:tRNA-2-methylthio-N6-dimethylallyladenosine synthase